MSKIRVGVFGLLRGETFVHRVLEEKDDAELVAVCDKNPETREAIRKKYGDGFKYCETFDELLDCGLDCVFLCNYFNEHASFAIKAFERGVAVFSECTTASTLKECAELCDAYEKYNGKYMLGENYPFTAPMLEIEKKVREGKFGKILYAEGEYNHTGTRQTLKSLTPDTYHWRAYLARTYYSTHSLGPLMYSTKEDPISVSAFAVHSDVLQNEIEFRQNYDAFAMMTCRTNGGALFRFNGNAHMASPSGYRIVGERGSGETGRSLESKVYIHYHDWTRPEDELENNVYQPEFEEKYRNAKNGGHGGGDYITVRTFLDYVAGGETPYFDIYRGCAMSAVAILGWRSCLENGKVYDIPDFHDKAQRDAVRCDDLTPFPGLDGTPATLPCHI